jgi:hypothetical protein
MEDDAKVLYLKRVIDRYETQIALSDAMVKASGQENPCRLAEDGSEVFYLDKRLVALEYVRELRMELEVWELSKHIDIESLAIN